jgi:hypothetical protein
MSWSLAQAQVVLQRGSISPDADVPFCFLNAGRSSPLDLPCPKPRPCKLLTYLPAGGQTQYTNELLRVSCNARTQLGAVPVDQRQCSPW